MNPTPKSIFASRTFWFNILAAVAQCLPGVAAMIPQPYGALAQSLINIGLRFITTQPISVP